MFRRDTACRVRQSRERNNPLETFHRNVSKIAAQQAGHKDGAVLFAPPSKSCRFSHPPSPCARSMAQGISLSADSDLEGTCPLRTPRQLRSAGAAFSGQQFWNHFVPARCFLYSLIGRSVPARCVPKQKRTRRTVSLLRIEPRKTKKCPKAYASEHLNLVTRTGIEPMIPP